MERLGLGISNRLDPRESVREAVSHARAGLGELPVDAALVAVTSATGGPALEQILLGCEQALGCSHFVGASVDGLMAAGLEEQGRPALAVMALSGVEVDTFFCEDLRGHEAQAGERIASQLGRSLEPSDLVVLFTDPIELDGRALASGLGEALGGARMVGLGASELPGVHRSLVWEGSRCASGAVAGLVLGLRAPARIAVTNACSQRSGILEVTRSRGHWLHGLDGRPALEVYRDALPAALRRDLDRARSSYLVAVVPDAIAGGEGPLPLGGLELRAVVGHDAERGLLGLAEPLRTGTRLVVVGIDAGVGRDRLLEDLRAAAQSPSLFGLYLACRSRGRALFGHDGVERHYLERTVPDVPILGLTGATQLVAGDSCGTGARVLTHAGVLALAAGR